MWKSFRNCLLKFKGFWMKKNGFSGWPISIPMLRMYSLSAGDWTMQFPMEGSLKLKEVSYIHSEAYAAGELKHGTISLVENGTLVVGVATQSELFEKEISNLVEVKSRAPLCWG